jgi:hypothetical protein
VSQVAPAPESGPSKGGDGDDADASKRLQKRLKFIREVRKASQHV